MTRAPEALDAVLNELGHPRGAARPDPSPFGYPPSESTYGEHVREWALFEPLNQRGWLLHFDAEGSYMLPGEHTKLIQALLTVAGVAPLPQVREGWATERGWALAVEGPECTRALSCRSELERPSDWVELGAVVALVDGYLTEHTVISLLTDDQSAALAVLPGPVFQHLEDEAWLVPAEEAEWRLDPELLLFETARELTRQLPVEELALDRVWSWAAG